MSGSLSRHDDRGAPTTSWRAGLVFRPDFGVKSQTRAVKEAPIFPTRPDLTILSESIPLFYVGKNRHGLWVARESEGRSGGLFLTQRSALGFARRQSVAVGCATKLLNEAFELDVENQGSRTVGALTRLIDRVNRRIPRLAATVGAVLAEWRKLVAEIARATAGARRNRAIIERDLFRDEYQLVSKGDDDLPIV